MAEQEVQIGEVGPRERQVLHGWLQDAAEWGIDIDDLGSLDRAYDDYVASVLSTDPGERDDPTPVCTMIGLAMGEHIARNTPLEWRVVTDAEGTDLALVTPREDAILYPADPVADAWSDQKVGWLGPWASELIRGVNEGLA